MATPVYVPLRLAAARLPDPASVLGLAHHEPGSVSDAEVRALYTDGEQRMRSLDELLIRDGVGVDERARTLAEPRDSLHAWTCDLMRNRITPTAPNARCN